jgi:plastocyanin domain-containing protein
MLFLLSIPFIISGAVNADNEEKTHSEKTYRAIPDQDGVQRVSIIGGSYFFTPSHIIVKVNMPVELKVKKEPGIVPHNIVSKSAEAGIKFDEALDSEPKLIKFTPTKVGIFPFYCDKKLLFFESHQEKGMTGKIEVVP